MEGAQEPLYILGILLFLAPDASYMGLLDFLKSIKMHAYDHLLF